MLELWFDLANNFEDAMAEQNLVTFCKLFEVRPSSRVKLPVSKPDFIDVFIKNFESKSGEDGISKLHSLTQTKFMIIGLMGIKQKGDITEQHRAICAVLGQNYDEEYELERYIQQNLHKEQTCYVINKRFWDAWSISTKENNKTPDTIDNAVFIEEGHQTRWKEDLVWNVDFVVVPACIYRAFNNWYSVNKEIEIKASIKT